MVGRMHGRRAASIIPRAFSRLTKPTVQLHWGRPRNGTSWRERAAGLRDSVFAKTFHGHRHPFRSRVDDTHYRVDRFWLFAFARRYRRAIL
jgi:hypothetical protein